MTAQPTEGPAWRRALVALGLVAVLVVGGCRPPFRDGDDEADKVGEAGTPRPELGITPSPLPADGTSGTTTTTVAAATTSTAATGGGSTTTTTTATTIADTYRTAGTGSDRRGDHGADGPGYADLVTLTVDRGTRTMRFVIDMGGNLPAALAAGEVEGIGVDLFRGLGLESTYQVFVDGGSDGWRAFFQRGTEFVQYPGTFRLGGGKLELVVPLSAFADGEPERASTFADWSERTGSGNRNSEDHLPELGAVRLS